MNLRLATRRSLNFGGVSVLVLAFASAATFACSSSEDSAGSTSDLTNGNAPLTKAVSTDLESGPSAGRKYAPAAAFDGTNFLVVWLEDESVVMAARVSQDGKVLDARSIALSAKQTATGKPRVAFDGKSFLVVWTRKDDKGRAAGVRAARIGTDGKVLDATPIELGSAAALSPSVAFNGESYLVTWSDRSTDGKAWDVFGALVAPDGKVSGDADGTRLAASLASQKAAEPSVAAAGSTFFVAWDEERLPDGAKEPSTNVYGIRVGGDGKIIDEHAMTLGAGGAIHPSVVSDGTDFLVTSHTQSADDASYDVIGSRISRAGELLDAAPLPLMNLGAAGGDRSLTLWDGEAYVVVGSAFKRFTNALAPMEGPPGALASSAAIAASPKAYLQLSSRSTAPLDLFEYGALEGTLVSRGEGAATKTNVYPARGDDTQRRLASATDGTDHLVVWEEFRTDWFHPEIWGAIMRADGTLADTTGFRIAASETGALTAPSVAFDGTDYVVAWSARTFNAAGGLTPGGDVGTARVTKKGVVQPAVLKKGVSGLPTLVPGNGLVALTVKEAVFTDLTAAGKPLFSLPMVVPSEFTRLTWTGSQFVGAWVDSNVLYAQAFSQTGAPKETRIKFEQALTAPELSSDGKGNTLIVWDRGGTIAGARIDASGKLLDAKPFELVKQASNPTVMHDGHHWLIGYDNAAKRSPEVAFFDVTQTGLERVGTPVGVGSYGESRVRIGKQKDAGALVTYETPNEKGGKRGVMRHLTYTPSDPAPSPAPTGSDTNSYPAPTPSGSGSSSYEEPPPTGDGYNSGEGSTSSRSLAARKSGASAGCSVPSTQSNGSAAGGAVLLALAGILGLRRKRS